MFTRINFVVFIAVLLGLSVSAQEREHFLDLAGTPGVDGMLTPAEAGQVPLDQRLGPGVTLVTSHGVRRESPFPFRVTLLRFDTGSYSARDPFLYEVRLQNSGDRPISFPWSVDQSLFSKTARESLVVYLGLADIDDKKASGDIGLVVLYGSADVPGSTEIIQPREVIRIRIRSQWMVFSGGTKRMQVLVRPSSNGIAYPTITSDNSLPIVALGKPR